MIKPRCPFCNAGIDKLASQRLGPALLVYCGQCGAIHGVVPIPPQKPNPKPVTKIKAAPRPAPDPAPAPAPALQTDEKKPAPSPAEEALSFWTQPGQHGFYTRMVTDEE